MVSWNRTVSTPHITVNICMSIKNSNQSRTCILVDEYDDQYLGWGRDRKRRSNHLKKTTARDPLRDFDRRLQQNHQHWEQSVRSVLGIFFKLQPNRILKYFDSQHGLSFREIDAIIELNSEYIFCEIKSRNHCDINNLGSSWYKDGWLQVKKSSAIASECYKLSPPILLIIDMSFAFGIKYSKNEIPPSYKKISEIAFCLESKTPWSCEYEYKGERVRLFWIDSREIVEFASEIDILDSAFLENFRESHRDRVNQDVIVESYLKKEFSPTTSPFSVLEKLKK